MNFIVCRFTLDLCRATWLGNSLFNLALHRGGAPQVSPTLPFSPFSDLSQVDSLETSAISQDLLPAEPSGWMGIEEVSVLVTKNRFTLSLLSTESFEFPLFRSQSQPSSLSSAPQAPGSRERPP